jgi:hypothetical protein
MRYGQMALVALVALTGSACGNGGASDPAEASEPPASTLALPCGESEQTAVALDVPGPGQPTPEAAVTPYAGALTLVVQERGGETTVFGLRDDNSVLRAFQVTRRDDGWWPEGYRVFRLTETRWGRCTLIGRSVHFPKAFGAAM